MLKNLYIFIDIFYNIKKIQNLYIQILVNNNDNLINKPSKIF